MLENEAGNTPAPEMPDDAVTATEQEQPTETKPVEEQTPQERLYNKQQIIEMMKRRVERSHNAFFKRYGVANLKELDDRFALASKYDELNNQFAPIQARNDELVRENAFLRNNIRPDRYDDIAAYFKGRDLEFTEEALLEAIKTHPEWLNPSTTPTPKTTMKSFGIEKQPARQETEDEKFNRFYGYK